jgi:hypothetical protein
MNSLRLTFERDFGRERISKTIVSFPENYLKVTEVTGIGARPGTGKDYVRNLVELFGPRQNE